MKQVHDTALEAMTIILVLVHIILETVFDLIDLAFELLLVLGLMTLQTVDLKQVVLGLLLLH